MGFSGSGTVRLADSRKARTLQPEGQDSRFRWVITSPPYYDMRTYIPDQWLRNGFIGDPDVVDYMTHHQIVHSSPDHFTADLRHVWRNVETVCTEDAKMVIRFGGIPDRHANPLDLIQNSLRHSGWHITAIQEAGSAMAGKRQADTFLLTKTPPMDEYDVWADRR